MISPSVSRPAQPAASDPPEPRCSPPSAGASVPRPFQEPKKMEVPTIRPKFYWI